MKTIKYSFLFVVLLFSCQEVLDRAPDDKLYPDQVWKSESMVQGLVTNLYSRFPFFAFEQGNWYSWTDEGTQSTGNSSAITQGTVSRSSELSGMVYWDYAYIRDCNVFLENIGKAEVSEENKKQWEGEVRFIRAYAYFEMMRRYGGIPLVDVVLDPFSAIDDKYVVRSKEEDIVAFIDSELTKAVALLADVPTPRGRINKWSAYALQARANLWAASIAKFSTVQLNGIVGIPAEKANTYYQKASAAASQVINSGKYALYNGDPSDKSENYRKIFVTANSELIFVRPYDGVMVGHSWDEWMGPNQWASRGGQGNPTLDFILGYENADGSTDQPAFGTANLYDNGAAPFAKKDPRLFGTVFFQGDKWATITVQSYEGLDPSATPTPSAVITNPNQSYKNIPCVGDDSRNLTKDDFSTNSGFHIKKFVDNTRQKTPNGQSKTSWIVFRLAEMYLIKAEAEFEQGNKLPAVAALNMTRERAGISLVDENTISQDRIRNEWTSEMAFETHRYWNLRRWRQAHNVLNTRVRGLQTILHYPSSDEPIKFYFIPFNAESFTRVYRQEHYYNPITNGRINNNPKLVENPLY
jgi:starch-binding outer membrane protein, SusD/RagB family